MPTFVDHSGADRKLRVLPAFAPPLPTSSSSEVRPGKDHYDVVIVGAGPAGLFLNLLLARYGFSDESVICIDQKPGILQSGQADGLQPRTLEVLQSLDLAHEVLTEGCPFWEVGFWNATEDGAIKRTNYAPDIVAAARYPHEITIHQGRIERILSEDLEKYSERGVQHGTQFVDFKQDPESNKEFPLEIQIENALAKDEERPSTRITIRAKHIIAADGAHSNVRRAAGLSLVGESRDHIWGVVDFVCSTDFPDIRRRCAIHSNSGSAMVIPRERISTGEYLTRLYIQMDDVDAHASAESRARRGKVTLDTIFDQAKAVFQPYKFDIKTGTEPDWWAAYQIGQRIVSSFTVDDAQGVPRVFVAGDAAHTHSPKAGQGMNISLMDSYNLAWKLAYHLKGLSEPSRSLQLLATYSSERKDVAEQLIDFDTRFSGMFSGKIGAASSTDGGKHLTHEAFLEVFSKASGFSSGCGLEYGPSMVVTHLSEDIQAKWPGWPAARSDDLLKGMLWPGRRLMNVRVIRHADGAPKELQDSFPSTGRYRLLVLTSNDLMNLDGGSASVINACDKMIDSRPSGVVELVVIHPLAGIRGCEFKTLPGAIHKHAEMQFFSANPEEGPVGKDGREEWRAQHAYKIFGVDPGKGRVALIRPDGYVAAMGELDDWKAIGDSLDKCLISRGKA